MFYSQFWLFFLEGNSILHILNLLCLSLSNCFGFIFFDFRISTLYSCVFFTAYILLLCSFPFHLISVMVLFSSSFLNSDTFYHFLFNHRLEFRYFCFWCTLEKLLPNLCLFHFCFLIHGEMLTQHFHLFCDNIILVNVLYLLSC